ncbi:hypothetical protein CIHG_03889 [Coccidioides immitis H538.4]|uniref:Uncharacterized protein n=3 Tax=Coccidioides immitis TaxID=5501 RepID=A0A0J8QS58_COCIT|nr:hypothetical protein CIRG_03636 [Coccidioides immitis RMSCC 2394]KMU74920.1 hypothetical protein CISG_00849 [Coccidioides immitis RMSCC 3703]KMU86101.1 hypothetical protein CIHG_03889 [Coccidioides immitis H538.4]
MADSAKTQGGRLTVPIGSVRFVTTSRGRQERRFAPRFSRRTYDALCAKAGWKRKESPETRNGGSGWVTRPRAESTALVTSVLFPTDVSSRLNIGRKQSSLSVFRSSKDELLCRDKSTRARFQVSRSFDEKNATSYSVLLYIGKHPYAEPYASEMAPTIHNSKKESIAISQMIGGHMCLVAHTSPDDPTNCIKPAHHLEELHA